MGIVEAINKSFEDKRPHGYTRLDPMFELAMVDAYQKTIAHDDPDPAIFIGHVNDACEVAGYGENFVQSSGVEGVLTEAFNNAVALYN